MKREEAIEIIRKNMPSDKSLPVYEALHSLIPELTESEDERIRKEIVSIVQSYRDSCISEGTHRFDDCLAWLEKQKHTAPNEYDEKMRKKIIDHLESIKMGCVICTIDTSEEIAWLEKQKDLDKMIVISPEVWDNAITDAYENGKRDSEKQKEQKPLKVGENAYFDPNTEMWFIKKEQKLAEDKELLKNILFQKKGITYDDYKCKNDPYVGLSFYELIKCLEEYDKARSNR